MSISEILLGLINHERAAAGAAPVVVEEKLSAAAQAHAIDMATNDYFSHTSSDGRSPQDRAAEHGYTAYGAENIAYRQHTPHEVVRVWMNSDSHRTNILNPTLSEIGIGIAERGDGGPMWVTKFGRQTS